MVSSRSNSLTNQIVHDCVISGLGGRSSTHLRFRRMSRTLVSLGSFLGHVTAGALDSNGRLSPLLVHLILHEDSLCGRLLVAK